MKIATVAALLAVTSIGAIASAKQPATRPVAPALKLERVVMLMRHGIRPPTKAMPVPARYTGETTWPSWSVDYGLLTVRGAAGNR